MEKQSAIKVWGPGPAWGMPSASPFVVKLLTWLRMAEIPFELRQLKSPPRSDTGKVPYIEAEDSTLLADSSVIIERLKQTRAVDPDAHLDSTQRAHALLLQRTLEEHLYFVLAWDRWDLDRGFAELKPAYFADLPWLLRGLVPNLLRRKVRQYLHGQGVRRLPEAEIVARGRADIQAIASILGDRPFLFGAPSSIDATAFALLGAGWSVPFASPLKDAIESNAALREYLARMQERYWPN